MQPIVGIAHFSEKNYEDLLFRNCTITTNCIDTTFTNCIFEHCNFEGIHFQNCYFETDTFKQCTGTLVKFIDTTFQKVTFTQSKFVGSDFTKLRTLLPTSLNATETDFSFSTFFQLKIPQSIFLRCNLKDADFTEAILKGTSFVFSQLERAVFQKADLENVDFRGAKDYALDIKNTFMKNALFSHPEVMTLFETIPIKIQAPPEDEEMV